jgi:hypothetical protein
MMNNLATQLQQFMAIGQEGIFTQTFGHPLPKVAPKVVVPVLPDDGTCCTLVEEEEKGIV